MQTASREAKIWPIPRRAQCDSPRIFETCPPQVLVVSACVMISADKYPAFSRNFDDEEDYLAAKSAVHSRFDAALGLSPVPQI
eukprot:17842-Heterococcus_DN1.PRE.1